MACCVHNSVMSLIKGLDNHPALMISPACPARNLGEDLKCPFPCPEIRKSQGEIGGYHAHKCNIGKVISLCNHLCAYQYIYLIPAEFLQDIKCLPFSTYAVPVQSGSPRL